MRKGFTLIEISIVLVIIGLIAGGILVGRELIKLAELRAMVRDLESYNLALKTFKLKYNGLPGDMLNATDFWPEDVSCPTTPSNPVRKVETCDGDGNGKIRTMYVPETYYEPFRAIQQLSNANLIAGMYSGVAGPYSDFDSDPGVNMPLLKYPDASIYLANDIDTAPVGHGWYFAGEVGLIIQAGKKDPPDVNSWPSEPFLSPINMRSVDMKYDDGKPGQGFIKSYVFGSSYNPTCATSDDPALAQYSVSDELLCSLTYLIK